MRKTLIIFETGKSTNLAGLLNLYKPDFLKLYNPVKPA